MPFTSETAAIAGRKGGGRPKGTFSIKFREYVDEKGWKKLLKWCESDEFSESFPALKFVTEMGYGKPTEYMPADGQSVTPEDSKRKAEEIWAIIKALEVHANTRTGVRSDPVSVVSGSPQVQA